MAEEAKTDPSQFLSDIIGSSVSVKLHNGVEYHGNLQSIDGYMNVVLEETAELVAGQPLGKKYGDVFIRGNNGMYQARSCGRRPPPGVRPRSPWAPRPRQPAGWHDCLLTRSIVHWRGVKRNKRQTRAPVAPWRVWAPWSVADHVSRRPFV